MNGDSLTARFIVESKWEDLPEVVQNKVKMCLLDDLSATISGAQAEVSRIATQFASGCMPGDQERSFFTETGLQQLVRPSPTPLQLMVWIPMTAPATPTGMQALRCFRQPWPWPRPGD